MKRGIKYKYIVRQYHRTRYYGSHVNAYLAGFDNNLIDSAWFSTEKADALTFGAYAAKRFSEHFNRGSTKMHFTAERTGAEE